MSVGFQNWPEDEPPAIRTFDTGATRDADHGKPDYPGYLSPLVIQAYGQYMLANQTLADGTVREGSNWKQGIPKDAYMQSLLRHMLDLWLHHEGHADKAREPLLEALMAVLFNASGYAHELLKDGL